MPPPGFNEAALLRVRKGDAARARPNRDRGFNEAALLRVRKAFAVIKDAQPQTFASMRPHS